MADVTLPRIRGRGRDDADADRERGRPGRHGADRDGTDGDEDRAQIILITGLTLAVLFVAVVLLLNTVIYTENLATRGTDAGGAEAIEFRDSAVEDLGGILYREHRNGSENVTRTFAVSAETYGRTIADFRTRDKTIADVRVNLSTAERGYFIAQNETDGGVRNMTAPDDSTANWTLVNDVSRARNYRLTVNSTSLSNDEGGAFAVVADGADEDWSVTLSNNSTDAITVRVRNATIDDSRTFTHGPDGNVTIDLTAGTVGGQRFPKLVWAGGVQNGTDPNESYDITYENGDEARGTYHLVVDDCDGCGADPPPARFSGLSVVEGIYSVDVELSHRTPELTYGDVVRIAPGERDA
ncbi:hypothetical protein J2744_000184 [Halorubrum trapanicum]|uniref:Uncharacterized protein n=1 Tax=Halorubrum trapanicum TaxID=29284 RepID=A0A8J7RRD5_9EURY|nr:hypothetical protein [Halorubrum trapanicum]MBP1900532.1 hypothetical protein [Halorubrum trapanicum]